MLKTSNSPTMKYLFSFLIVLQLACSSTTSQVLNHIPSKTMNLEELIALVNDGSPEKYTVLYYSADYCPPCKKVKKVLDEKVPRASYYNIRLIEMNEKDFENGTVNPVLAKYKIRVVPTFILVDKELNELNRNRGRGWKKENAELDKFIKDVWPDKTPEEKQIEKDRQDQSRKQSRLFAALREDTNLSELSRGHYQEEFFKAIEKPYSSKTLRLESFEMFEKITESDFTETQKLKISFTSFSEEQQKSLLKVIPKFTNLEYLNFSGNQMVPEEIFQLKKLKILFLNGGYDRITLPEKVANLKELEHIKLGYSSIKLPKNIDQLKNLKSIMMPGLALEQPEELFMLENLEYLNLKFKSPEDLTKIKNLKKLRYLQTNHYNPSINSLTELRNLSLYNTLVGDISNLENLEILTLSGLPTCELNPSIFSLPSLTGFFNYTPYGNITYPMEVENPSSFKYVFLSYIKKWPTDIKIPDYLTKAKHYVPFVRR